ncbi:MAG: methyltransferase domain-containing protein [Solirubrobacteraceae bacterium]
MPKVRPFRAIYGAVLRMSPGVAPRLEKFVWRVVYEGASLRKSWTSLMNYGYAPLEGQAPVPQADGVGYGYQLYAKLAASADMAGKDVLEVGCGRGGGTAFVHERFHPRSMTGVDLARRAIEYCCATYPRPGLQFMVGDAENLPFANSSFDVVLNVESSHCYADMPRFLGEVRRVLRPGGLLLLADARVTALSAEDQPLLHTDDVARLRTQLEQARFRTIEEEDITRNVMRALELDTPDRRARIECRVPRFLRPHVHAFAAAEGSPMYQAYVEGKRTYLRFVLQPVSAGESATPSGGSVAPAGAA